MYGQKKNFSTFSYKLVQISPIMILVHSGAFLSISSWFCELTELIFVMIPYISSIGCPPTTQRIMGHVQVANVSYVIFSLAASIYVDPPSKNNLVCPNRTCLHHMPDTDVFFEEKSDDFPKDVARVEIGSYLADCFIYVTKLWIESGGFFIWFAGRVITLTSWQDCTSETHCTKRTWSLTGVSLRTIFLELS